MKNPSILLLLTALTIGVVSWSAQADEPPIDWQRARQLFQMEQRGSELSVEDQQYLNRAKEARRGGGGVERPDRPTRGDGREQRAAPETLKPLSDMTAEDRYEGEDGGLYGGGSNQPPEALMEKAKGILSEIRPLNAEGQPDEGGTVVLVSISMSNATQEFSVFKRIADAFPRKSENLKIIDCAQGGQAMAQWTPPEGRPWIEAMRRIEAAGATAEQVQVAWVKLANVGPSGSMKDHLSKLEADTTKVLQNAKVRFPNLKIAYLSSRIWAGNAKSGLNPEPYAYESAFGVRHLIQKQMAGEAELAADKVPLILWGPYLWAEGEKGRKIDDLKYLKADFAADGVHPSTSGREKVANQLLEFFATNALAKDWFAKKAP